MRLRDLGLQQGVNNSILLTLSEATMGKRTCSTCADREGKCYNQVC